MIQNETIRNVESIDDLTIMDDYMASKVFSDKKIMSDFLSILLGHPVNIIHCRKQVQIRPRKNAHYVIFDILAIDDHGNIYNLEIQDYGEKDLILRLTYNAGILISMALKKGKPYSELKNTTVLALCSSDPVGSGETYYDSSCPFENYPNMKMKPRTRMIALNAGGKKSSGNMDIDLLMDYIKTSRRNNGRLTVLLDDARQKICNDEKERDAFMTELYQGQKAGDRLARKQNKEMKKEIERMKAESAQYRELYQGQKAGDEIARKQVKEMEKEIERMKAESAQYRELYQGQKAGDEIARKQVKKMKKEIERMKAESAQYRELYQGQKAGDEIARKQIKEMEKEIDEMKKAADQNRKKYVEEKKNSALKLREDGMDIAKIASILNTEPELVNEWIVSENEASYHTDNN